MRDAAANLEFEEAARLRDEIKRLQAVELAIADDPLARQQAIEDRAGAYAGRRKYGSAANLPAKPARASRPTPRWARTISAAAKRARSTPAPAPAVYGGEGWDKGV